MKGTPYRARRGRVLATRFGLNPNSSSLGVDVTFLLYGAVAISFITPVMAALLRLRPPSDQVASKPSGRRPGRPRWGRPRSPVGPHAETPNAE
jgi:hypothetical protein